MALLYPIGLLALAGLIVPVVIHLWNVKKGKVLKIGSIALLGENATASSKNIKITDILLFIVRCLIITLIAFVLAQPYHTITSSNRKNAGWILIDKRQIGKVYEASKPTIDSLMKLGFEMRDFNLGFAKISLKDSTAEYSRTRSVSYTALLKELNTQIPSGYSANVFADRRLLHFEGNLPKPSFRLIWNDLPSGDTVKTWTTKFLAKIYEGKSIPTLTSYTSSLLQDLPPINAVIYEPNGSDSKYIKAALNAIASFTKRSIKIDNWNGSSVKADLLFWLSDKPVPLTGYKKGASLISYKKGKTILVNSTLQIASSPGQTLALKKRIAVDDQKGTTVWEDGFGEPILIKDTDANFNHFYFYSRFNAEWTELVWNEQFIKSLVPIVLGQPNDPNFGFETHDADQRILAQQQIPTTYHNATIGLTINNRQDLKDWIWGIAFVLLITERVLSLSKKTSADYGRG